MGALIDSKKFDFLSFESVQCQLLKMMSSEPQKFYFPNKPNVYGAIGHGLINFEDETVNQFGEYNL
jgi:hypothetical protein